MGSWAAAPSGHHPASPNRGCETIVNVGLREALGKSRVTQLPRVVAGVDTVTPLDARCSQTGGEGDRAGGNRCHRRSVPSA